MTPKHAAPEGAELWRLIDDYARKVAAVDFWSGKVKAGALLDLAYEARNNLRAALTQGKQQSDPKVCAECRHPIGSDACIHWVRLPQPLTSEEREVVREAIRDSAEVVAPGRMAVDRSQPVGLTEETWRRVWEHVQRETKAAKVDIDGEEEEKRLAEFLLRFGGKYDGNGMWDVSLYFNDIVIIMRALSVSASAPAGERPLVSEGWRLVPVEPTPEMCRAGEINWGDPDSGPWHTYERMVAASPSLPVSGDWKEGHHGD